MVSNHSSRGNWWAQAEWLRENIEWGSFYRESVGSPVSVHLWPCGDDDLYFPWWFISSLPKTPSIPPDHYMYTKQKPVAMEIAVDLGGMGRMNLGPVAGVEVSKDASLTLGGESSAKWGWYLTPRVEPIEGIDSSMEKEVITRTLANGKREWPWGATKRSTMCTKAWKETVKRVKTTLKGGLLSVVLINADDGCDYY